MLYQCSRCQAAKYCSKSCQRAHWGKHASLCNAISTLENESRENMETVFVSLLTPDQHQKVARLLGKGCTVFCKMNGKTVEALWDTGAQVSITSKDWLENNFPDLQVKSIQCLLDCGPELDLSAHLILNSDDGLTPVKTSKSDVIIPKAQSVIIRCRVNLITTSAKTPVVFEPNVLETVPPGLEINQSLLILNRGS